MMMRNLAMRLRKTRNQWRDSAAESCMYGVGSSTGVGGMARGGAGSKEATSFSSFSSSCWIFVPNLKMLCTSALVKRSWSSGGVLRWYLNMIHSHPLLTKSVTAATIFATADVTSQVITFAAADPSDHADVMKLDSIRTLRMTAYGLLLSGPTLHFWFNFVSTIFPKRDIASTLKKMFLGQTIYGPAITAVFYSLNALLQGESGSEILARLKRDLMPTLINGLMYWPLCDFLTFRYVPVQLQPLVSNSFSFVWTVYLTYMASLKVVDVEVERKVLVSQETA